MSLLMGGISREQSVMYLCANVCILMAAYDTWINELHLICPSLCVKERESVHVCVLVHHPAVEAAHAVDLCSPGLGSADPGLITVYHCSYSHDPTVTP